MQLERVTVPIGKANFSYMMNCYLVSAGKDATDVIIVDPGGGAQHILTTLGARTVIAIILTHCHIDHTIALDGLRSLWEKGGVPIYVHALDKAAVVSNLKRHGEEQLGMDIEPYLVPLEDMALLTFKGFEFEVLHTPGHSAGSMCLYEKDAKVLLSGDTLFRGTTGRTDLETGNPFQMHESLQLLAQLPDETVVYPGHDMSTSIAYERRRALVEY